MIIKIPRDKVEILEIAPIKQELNKSCSIDILSDVEHVNNTSKFNLTDDKACIQGYGMSEIEVNNAPNKMLYNQVQSTSKFHEKESFQCAMCADKFQFKNNLIKHLEKKHKSKRSYTKYISSVSSSPTFFKCLVCQKNFKSSSQMIKHTGKYHPLDTLFKCLFCEKYFHSVLNLTKHSKTIHSQSTHACVTCWKVYTSPEILKSHLKVCQTPSCIKVQTNCDVCGKILSSKHSLETHLRVHMGIVYPCTECSETFLHLKSLYRHRNIKHCGTISKCHVCMRTFSSYSDLKRHLATHTQHKHKSSSEKGNSELYCCDSCGKKFQRKDGMKDHIRAIHLNDYYCKTCSFRYSSIYAFKRHIETHHGGKEVTKKRAKLKYHHCNLCSKKYSEKRLLRDHLHVKHYDLPNVACEVCGNTSATPTSLRRHKKRNHGSVRLRCHLCEKSYALNYELQQHIRSTHLRASYCSKCNLTFRSNKTFMRHIQLECPGRYVCYYCNMISESKQKMECHIQGYHFLRVNVFRIVS